MRPTSVLNNFSMLCATQIPLPVDFGAATVIRPSLMRKLRLILQNSGTTVTMRWRQRCLPFGESITWRKPGLGCRAP